MKPTPEQLAYCLLQVTRYIPSPPVVRAKAQDSKWGVKVSQLFEETATGIDYLVVGVDSLGIEFEVGDQRCRIENKEDFETRFVRKKTARKARKKKQVQVPLGEPG